MATVNLGNIKFNWKGAYNAGTAYAIDDVVSYNGSSYVCISATTGNLPTVTAKWNQMSAAGTNGTDVGTTITTQGDLLYRDGSGLQRLAKGTASQVLKMNTAANAPEWGNLSSDFVKIASGSVSGSSSSVSIDGYYSSDYKNYKMYFQNIQNNNTNTCLRINFGGSPSSSSAYRAALHGMQNNNGSTSQADINSAWNSDRINITNWGATNGYGDIIILDIIEPQSTTYYKRVMWHTASYNGSEVHALSGQGYYHGNQSTASTGLQWLTGNGNNMTTGDWWLYGIKA